MNNTKALILIGGTSHRMGEDKYLLSPHGKPQYQYLYEMTKRLGLETYISCSKEQSVRIDSSYPIILDQQEGLGPMGGLYSAIQEDSTCSWLVIACDLIRLDGETLRQLLVTQPKEESVITFQKPDSPFLETTVTIYRPFCFPEINQLIKSRHYSLQRLLKKVKILSIVPNDPDKLHNANSPEDLL